jgi:superfamily II DNA or RNA helicase
MVGATYPEDTCLQLRGYQTKLYDSINAAYAAGARIVMAVLGCGGGKTAIFCYMLLRHVGYSLAVAHRQELVRQMSMTLAKYGVKHRIIGPDALIKRIIRLQIRVYGRDFYDPASKCAVAGVDTLLARSEQLAPWLNQVTFWVLDEGHHASGVKGMDWTTGNKWCRAAALMPNARGLLVTATPERADGMGLGVGQDGIVEVLVEGPGERELIDTGFLCDYRVICPPSTLDIHDLTIGKDGDVNRKQLSLRTRNSTVIGDVVKYYLLYAAGKKWATFAPDIETATIISKNFNDAGVPAEVITSNTPDDIRFEVLQKLDRREILQIVNVDILGEGYDCPSLEGISMCRYTESYPLYHQQGLRPCRPDPENPDKRAILIDHVGNFHRHGPPDRRRAWSLNRREKGCRGQRDPDVPLTRTCLNPDTGGGVPCMTPYERYLSVCPACGMEWVPSSRSSVEFVEGCLYELAPEVLAQMRGEVAKVDRHPDEVLHAMQRAGMPPPAAYGAAKQHEARQRAQATLREAMALWGGYQLAMGRGIREAQRRFYHGYGVDCMSAQALGRPDAEALTERVTAGICKLDAELRNA